MTAFVRIRVLEGEAQRTRHDFAGEIRSMGTRLVGRELLVDSGTGKAIAEVSGYPRRVEPPLVLLARLVLAVADGSFLGERFSQGMAFALELRPHQSLVLASDVLQVSFGSYGLNINLLSGTCIAAGHRVQVNRRINLAEAICLALRATLGWRRNIPPLPCALTQVRIRKTADREAQVFLADVPPVARHQLRKSYGLSPLTDRVDAVFWADFLLSQGAELRAGRL
ncbi:hypothetical protein VAR608DRAFT_1319 [Variovorax sp. HW608]|uniref:hypothetical protein n=1 Tax=Variovorax sp. HW608 TaxID=1034889 RepID=UPI00081FD8C6|nr:hypothetical protein [Variovorax sp. HW608]SCK18412.1 hypothetical protein VAR608DRAFT_1319 [Variovorax sp. HW608]